MKKLWIEFKQRPWWRKTLNIVELLFAMAGFGIVGAWAYFELGLTNDSGGNDQFTNERSLTAGIDINTDSLTQEQIDAEWALRYGRLAALARYYPVNARLILNAAQKSNNPLVIDRMIKAAEIYMGENKEMDKLTRKITDLLNNVPQQQSGNVIPWMDGPEWPALKEAILRDSALIIEAGRLTGVEPRLIVGCLVGEQIRLFNSKREMFKKYLGPVKVLSVQSQFSYGVNGIKEFTAKAVEEHLKDPN
ncbi:MAG: hypothetical protein J6X59_01155 [Bacteroidales bacterium]|nr:hypothetical protein [Bacteroidales bacterium]